MTSAGSPTSGAEGTSVTRVVRPSHGGAFEVDYLRAAQPSGNLPLVLVPGAGGPAGTFHHQSRAFAEDRDVLATNLNPAKASKIGSVESGVLDVLHVLDEFGVERCDIIGASFGSCVTSRLTAEHPDRVRSQILVAPPVVRYGPWLGSFGPGWLYGGALMKFAPERYRGQVARHLARGRIYAPEPDLDEQEFRLLAARVSDTALSPFFHRLTGLLRWDWGVLEAPAARPTLVIQGRVEHASTPPDVLETLARLSGRPIAIMGGRHMPYLHFPEEFNGIARGFLAGVSAPIA
ncbi:MAG: alpha/beta fold hydrolase [Candidatus Eiseniibacteriota bacterium]